MEFANEKRISLTIYGIHLQFADSTYILRIPLTVAESSTTQFNDTDVLSFVCGFLKYSCKFHKFAYLWSDFKRYNDLGTCLWNPKQHKRSKKISNVADFATNLRVSCCGFHLHCREYIA